MWAVPDHWLPPAPRRSLAFWRHPREVASSKRAVTGLEESIQSDPCFRCFKIDGTRAVGIRKKSSAVDLSTEHGLHHTYSGLGFSVDPVVKNPPANAGGTRDMGSIPGSGGSPGEENGNLLQYSCLGDSKDRGTWQATVNDKVTKESDTTYQLNNSNHKGSAEIRFSGGWKEDLCARGNLICKVQRKILSSLIWYSRLKRVKKKLLIMTASRMHTQRQNWSNFVQFVVLQ